MCLTTALMLCLIHSFRRGHHTGTPPRAHHHAQYFGLTLTDPTCSFVSLYSVTLSGVAVNVAEVLYVLCFWNNALILVCVIGTRATEEWCAARHGARTTPCAIFSPAALTGKPLAGASTSLRCYRRSKVAGAPYWWFAVDL